MHVLAHAAQLAGGVGVVLVGTWLATAGLGTMFGRRLGATAAADEKSWKSFLRGLCTAGLLGANGTLTTGAAGLARRAGVGAQRATPLLFGASFGPATIALLVLLVSRGWALPALALAALAVTAAYHTVRSRWTPWGEAAAGIALVVLGIQVLGSGWIGIGPWLSLPAVDQRPILIAVMVAFGLALGVGLRSPGAAAALIAQSTATHALDVLSAVAASIGVLASLGWSTSSSLRRGTADERSVAALHVIFALIAALIMAVCLLWSYRMPGLLVRAPGGPSTALALVLTASLAGATALTLALQRPLHWVLLRRLAPRGARALAGEMRAGGVSIPALALGGIGGAVDVAAASARDLGRKVLTGSGTSEQRRQQAREAVLGVCAEIDAFRAGLEGVRWPGEAVGAVLEAQRGARLWRDVLDILERLESAALPRGDEGLKLRFVRVRFVAMRLIECTDEHRVPRTVADLAPERELFREELRDLRAAIVSSCAAGTVDPARLAAICLHADLLGTLVRISLEAAECRERVDAADAFHLLPELPEDAEPLDEEPYQADGEAYEDYDEVADPRAELAGAVRSR